MTQLSKLWELQLLEKYQKGIVAKKSGDPRMQQLKQLKKEILLGQDTLKKLKISYQKTKEQSIELSQRSQELRAKSEEIGAKIYDGSLHLKEIEGSQQKVVRLQQDIQQLEDLELEKMQLKEDIKKDWQKERAALDVLTAKFRELNGQYIQEKEGKKEQAAATARKMEELIVGLDKGLYQQYQQLKEKYPDPVGRVTKDVCSGCHVGIAIEKIKELKQERDLVNCSYCGRILFWDPIIPG